MEPRYVGQRYASFTRDDLFNELNALALDWASGNKKTKQQIAERLAELYAMEGYEASIHAQFIEKYGISRLELALFLPASTPLASALVEQIMEQFSAEVHHTSQPLPTSHYSEISLLVTKFPEQSRFQLTQLMDRRTLEQLQRQIDQAHTVSAFEDLSPLLTLVRRLRSMDSVTL